jgi:hypothetical protein
VIDTSELTKSRGQLRVDARKRTARAIAAEIDPRLRRDIGSDPLCELWVYGEGRSCEIVGGDAGIACRFLVGQAQVAYASSLREVPTAVAMWLLDRVAISELTRLPDVTVERHAAVLEVDPARWHWLHVRDRTTDPSDALAPLRPVIDALAESVVATRFYSFSSLSSFCFSASSHYPWVNEGLPILAPTDEGGCEINGTPLSVAHAVLRIEATLAAHPVQPFFGSAVDREVVLLAEAFARQRSAQRPHVLQRGPWPIVAVGEGVRRCLVNNGSVDFIEGDSLERFTIPSVDDAARAIHRFIVDRIAPH